MQGDSRWASLGRSDARKEVCDLKAHKSRLFPGINLPRLAHLLSLHNTYSQTCQTPQAASLLHNQRLFVTLSVSTMQRISPEASSSPSFFFHSTMFPCVSPDPCHRIACCAQLLPTVKLRQQNVLGCRHDPGGLQLL